MCHLWILDRLTRSFRIKEAACCFKNSFCFSLETTFLVAWASLRLPNVADELWSPCLWFLKAIIIGVIIISRWCGAGGKKNQTQASCMLSKTSSLNWTVSTALISNSQQKSLKLLKYRSSLVCVHIEWVSLCVHTSALCTLVTFIPLSLGLSPTPSTRL